MLADALLASDAVLNLAAVTAETLVPRVATLVEDGDSLLLFETARWRGSPPGDAVNDAVDGLRCVAIAVRALLGMGGAGFVGLATPFALMVVEVVDLFDLVERTELTEDGRFGGMDGAPEA